MMFHSQARDKCLISSEAVLTVITGMTGTDKKSLADFARLAIQIDDPESLAVLINQLIELLKNSHNRWVFAAVGFVCFHGTQHKLLFGSNQSLAVSLLDAIATQGMAIHLGKKPDSSTLYYCLLALNASLESLVMNEIGQIDPAVYDRVKALLAKLSKLKHLDETQHFLLTHAKRQLDAVGTEHAKKSSIKEQGIQAGLNALLGVFLLGSGVTELVVGVGAAVATAGVLTPVGAAAGFGFLMLAGLSAERFYQSGQQVARIRRLMRNNQYMAGILAQLPWRDEHSPQQLLGQYQDDPFANLLPLVSALDFKKVGVDNTKTLIFTATQQLLSTVKEKPHQVLLFKIMTHVFEQHEGKSTSDKSVRLFILEQWRVLHQCNVVAKPIAEYISLKVEQSSRHTLKAKHLLDDLKWYGKRAERLSVFLAETADETKVTSNEPDVTSLITDMAALKLASERQAELNQEALRSQRAIQRICPVGDDQRSDCVVVPTTPNGNCGFEAIAQCIELYSIGGSKA